MKNKSSLGAFMEADEKKCVAPEKQGCKVQKLRQKKHVDVLEKKAQEKPGIKKEE